MNAKQNYKWNELTMGTCYYPEHWDRALWKDDLQRMKQYGIEVIRLAEFSWALMEPEEGKYDFSFWDEFLALAAEENMKVVFCTPTATPPAWLSEKYPETLKADESYLRNTYSNSSCMADRKISGSLKCTERWCASQTWRKKTL